MLGGFAFNYKSPSERSRHRLWLKIKLLRTERHNLVFIKLYFGIYYPSHMCSNELQCLQAKLVSDKTAKTQALNNL